MTLYDIEVTLEYVEPPIRRVLRVRDDTTLLHLHCAIQVAFGWWDAGLFFFEIDDREFGPPDPGGFQENSEAFTVEEILRTEDDPNWSYGYFPAEEALWVAGLQVRPAETGSADAAREAAVRCVDGSGAMPLEELGGPFAHMEALEAETGETSHAGNGAGRSGSAAEEGRAPFDPEAINQQLRRLETGGWDAVFGLREEEPPDEGPGAD